MLETAVEIVEEADVFVVIGTSLQVYPAASLINYTPINCKKYIIDKTIPKTAGITDIIAIEKPATEGVEILKRHLLG